MLSSFLNALLKLSKTTSPKKLFDNDDPEIYSFTWTSTYFQTSSTIFKITGI